MLKNVDSKDLAILRELDQNVRVSAAQIGRKTRLSKEVVQYRIKKLEERKIITNYWAFINQEFLHIYKILIKNRNLAGEKRKEFIEFVKNHKNASWFATTEGNFDYIITTNAQSNKEIIEFTEELFKRYGSYFQEKHILKAVSATITNEKFLYPNGRFIYNYVLEPKSAIIPEDEIEQKLLREISSNSRARFTELAPKLKLTAEAVAQRFKRIMKKKLVTGLKMRLNLENLGLSHHHMFIALRNQSAKEKIISYYTMHPDFNSMMLHIGYYDMHLEFMLPEDKIQDVIEDFITRFGDNVASYELLNIREEHVMNIIK